MSKLYVCIRNLKVEGPRITDDYEKGGLYPMKQMGSTYFCNTKRNGLMMIENRFGQYFRPLEVDIDIKLHDLLELWYV